MVQIYLAWPTHQQMIRLLLFILSSDNMQSAQFLNRPLPGGETPQSVLERAVKDADTPSCGYIPHNVHFHHPWSHCGLFTAASAGDAVTARFRAARKLGRRHPQRALYEIGRALHLVQDMWVPHHAALKVCSGHGQFERYLASCWTSFAVTSGGYYKWTRQFTHKVHGCHRFDSTDPSGFVELGAHISYPLFRRVRDQSAVEYSSVASIIIPGCLRAGAGFLNLATRSALPEDPK